MRPEGNPLDLNNLPEEYGKQSMEESSTTTATSADNTSSNAGFKKKKSGKEKDESGNVYECRFCSLKFCKSQALGGHMNRHRQERETETLNRARQLVFSNDGFAGVGAHMGLRDLNFGGGSGQPMASGCFPHGSGIADPCLHFRPVYPMLPTRPAAPSHLHQPYMYPPSASRPLSSYPAPYPVSVTPPPPTNDYYMGRVVAGSSHTQPQNSSSSIDLNYSRLGASSLNQNITMEGVRQPVGRDATPGSRNEGGSWNCGYGYGQHNSDPSSTDRF